MKIRKAALFCSVAIFVVVGGAGALLFLGADAGAAPKEPPPPMFVELEPLVVNLQTESENQYVQLGISLRLRDASSLDAVKSHLPELRHALIMLVSSKRADQLDSVEKKKLLGEEIKDTANRSLRLGPPHPVSATMFSSFIVQ